MLWLNMHCLWYIAMYVLFTSNLLALSVVVQPNMEYFKSVILDAAFLAAVWLFLVGMYLKENEVIQLFEEEPHRGRARPRGRARSFPG